MSNQKAEFKIGDVVKLKSGGPNMTVTGVGKVSEDSHQISAWCTWFPSSENRKTDVFPVEAIELVTQA